MPSQPLVLENPIPLPLHEIAPTPDRFQHPSYIHGEFHVARVIIHGFLLTRLTGHEGESVRLWAAAWLHDIGRTHDGYCEKHGRNAVKRVSQSPSIQNLLSRGGVREEDWNAIFFAVEHHCLPKEVPRSHPYRVLTALLKDCDGLDRTRLGDLNPRYLRFPATRTLIPFARQLTHLSETRLRAPHDQAAGPLFPRLWGLAQQILADMSPTSEQDATA